VEPGEGGKGRPGKERERREVEPGRRTADGGGA
jgi:hypothetical protein